MKKYQASKMRQGKTRNLLTNKKFILYLLIVFCFIVSCTKKGNDLQTSEPDGHYCAQIAWKNSLGNSGNFDGTIVNGKYHLSSAYFKEGTDETTFLYHYDSQNHIINDNSNMVFTYSQNNISQYVYTYTGGKLTFTFNAQGQLTKVLNYENNSSEPITRQFTYTYDANGDPTKILGHIEMKTNSGTTKGDYTIIGDYLINYQNVLAPSPEITLFSSFFAYTYYTSKHLINKWQIHQVLTDELGNTMPANDFTQEYTYTFNSDGHLASMKHTGNSQNIFTFALSQCE